jgi:hypothetical protein
MIVGSRPRRTNMTTAEIREALATCPEDERVIGAVNIVLSVKAESKQTVRLSTHDIWDGVGALWDVGELAEVFGPEPTGEEVEAALAVLVERTGGTGPTPEEPWSAAEVTAVQQIPWGVDAGLVERGGGAQYVLRYPGEGLRVFDLLEGRQYQVRPDGTIFDRVLLTRASVCRFILLLQRASPPSPKDREILARAVARWGLGEERLPRRERRLGRRRRGDRRA